jgi:hypothetical protein
MNKKSISLFGAIGVTVGAYVPSLFGDNDIFSTWSILGGLVGGIVGFWLGVQIGKRF